MSVAEYTNGAQFTHPPIDCFSPNLVVVPPIEQLWGRSISTFDGYVPASDLTDLSRSPKLAEDNWKPNYRPESYDRDRQIGKLKDVADLLKLAGNVNHDVLNAELAESIARTNKTFDLYEGRTVPDFDGSFAFVVPTRIDRESADYGDEILPYLTILRHVDNATRQLTLAGTCPWVLDIYNPDTKGKQGAMIFAPVFKDLARDSKNDAEALDTSHAIIQDTILFARNKLGVNVAGLGATLPLLTYMAEKYLGKKLEIDGVTTTTGHGGTVWLLHETIKKAIAKLYVSDSVETGIIGVGGIGKSTADYILNADNASTVRLFDKDPAKTSRVADELRAVYGEKRVRTAPDAATLVRAGGIIVSAITTPLDLSDEVYRGGPPALWVDDSQPHGVNRSQVEILGGNVAWVIGRDNTPTTALTLKNGFNYSGWGPAMPNEVWGCQAEAGVVHLMNAPEAAIRNAVTPASARLIGELCTEAGIGTAELQSFGRYLK